MAITEDIDWISILDENESVLPPLDLMLKRIMLSHNPIVWDGVVYSEKQVHNHTREVALSEENLSPQPDFHMFDLTRGHEQARLKEPEEAMERTTALSTHPNSEKPLESTPNYARIFSLAMVENRISSAVPEPSGFQHLEQAMAPDAFENSSDWSDQPKCHPGTRVTVIDRIMAWIRIAHDPREDEPTQQHVMWLTGKAGEGKSAIAQKIAEMCEGNGLLFGRFFFLRTDTTRNNGKSLIATIAYQMSSVFPETRPHLEHIIDHDPLVFTRSVEEQVLSLIVAPMQELSPVPAKRLVIIDGLDECNDLKVQENIVNVILTALSQHSLPLIFFITSRPEPHIANVFSSSQFRSIVMALELKASLDTDADIRLFLTESFNEIRATHCLRSTIPHIWPTSSALDTLVRMSSGQFIYASLVKKYVQSARHHPSSRLDVCLGLLPAGKDNPFSELDVLYKHIFEQLEDTYTALSLLTFLSLRVARDGLTKDDIEFASEFLGLELPRVEVCVENLMPLLTINPSTGPLRYLSISHAFFPDFLFDPLRSGHIHVDIRRGHAMMAQRCLKNLTKYSSKPEQVMYRDITIFSAISLQHHCTEAAMTEDLKSKITKLSIYNIYPYFLAPFCVNWFGGFLDWMEGQTWQGSQDAYVRLCIEHHEILETMIQKYIIHPETTLLSATMVEEYMGKQLQGMDDFARSAIMDHIFRLDNDLSEMDQNNMNLKSKILAGMPLRRRIAQILSHRLNKERYSTAALVLLKYLCSNSEHNGQRYGPFTLQKRRTQPWMWRRIRKPDRAMDRDRRVKEFTARLRHSDRSLTKARARKTSIAAYKLALRLFASLLRRAIATEGTHNPQLVAFTRRCTFAMLAIKFPRKKKDAEAAIAELLASVDAQKQKKSSLGKVKYNLNM